MLTRAGKKWGNLDLNQGPAGYESAALTTELLPHEEVDPSKNIKKNQVVFSVEVLHFPLFATALTMFPHKNWPNLP